MKKINFDYKSDKITTSLGMSDAEGDQLNQKCSDITFDMLKGKLTKPALLAERVYAEFSEEEKLMCIVQFLMNALEKIVEIDPAMAFAAMKSAEIDEQIDRLINEN
jgi:hypothetical protein